MELDASEKLTKDEIYTLYPEYLEYISEHEQYFYDDLLNHLEYILYENRHTKKRYVSDDDIKKYFLTPYYRIQQYNDKHHVTQRITANYVIKKSLELARNVDSLPPDLVDAIDKETENIRIIDDVPVALKKLNEHDPHIINDMEKASEIITRQSAEDIKQSVKIIHKDMNDDTPSYGNNARIEINSLLGDIEYSDNTFKINDDYAEKEKNHRLYFKKDNTVKEMLYGILSRNGIKSNKSITEIFMNMEIIPDKKLSYSPMRDLPTFINDYRIWLSGKPSGSGLFGGRNNCSYMFDNYLWNH